MIEFILALVFWVFTIWLAFTIGFWYRGFVIATSLTKVLTNVQEKNEALMEKLKSSDLTVVEGAITEAAKSLNITLLKVEQVDGVYYFYTKDTDFFICQGNSLDEACENYYKANKSSIGCVADPTDQTDSYFIVEGKIKHSLSND